MSTNVRQARINHGKNKTIPPGIECGATAANRGLLCGTRSLHLLISPGGLGNQENKFVVADG